MSKNKRERKPRGKKKVRILTPIKGSTDIYVSCVYECGCTYRTARRTDDNHRWHKTLRCVNAHESQRCPLRFSARGETPPPSSRSAPPKRSRGTKRPASSRSRAKRSRPRTTSVSAMLDDDGAFHLSGASSGAAAAPSRSGRPRRSSALNAMKKWREKLNEQEAAERAEQDDSDDRDDDDSTSGGAAADDEAEGEAALLRTPEMTGAAGRPTDHMLPPKKRQRQLNGAGGAGARSGRSEIKPIPLQMEMVDTSSLLMSGEPMISTNFLDSIGMGVNSSSADQLADNFEELFLMPEAIHMRPMAHRQPSWERSPAHATAARDAAKAAAKASAQAAAQQAFLAQGEATRSAGAAETAVEGARRSTLPEGCPTMVRQEATTELNPDAAAHACGGAVAAWVASGGVPTQGAVKVETLANNSFGPASSKMSIGAGVGSLLIGFETYPQSYVPGGA